jgi:hypothetical protein
MRHDSCACMLLPQVPGELEPSHSCSLQAAGGPTTACVLPVVCTAGVELSYLVLDFSPVTHIDASGMHALETWIVEAAGSGVQVRGGGVQT